MPPVPLPVRPFVPTSVGISLCLESLSPHCSSNPDEFALPGAESPSKNPLCDPMLPHPISRAVETASWWAKATDSQCKCANVQRIRTLRARPGRASNSSIERRNYFYDSKTWVPARNEFFETHRIG